MKKNFAFSLTELSVVILIVGILIAAIAQSSKLVKKSRLTSAQSLTENSPVNEMSGLVAWYETSLERSFIVAEVNDGGGISTWYDRNSEAVNKNHAVQATSANQPTFYIDAFNNAIPALRFDGTNDFMPFNGSTLTNNPYTIFVVEQRRSNASANYFLGGTTIVANSNLVLGYRANTTLTQSHYSNDLNITVEGYVTPTPKIHTFQFDSTNGKKYWDNSDVTPHAADAGQTAALISYDGSALGRFGSNYYNGDLAEVIIFNRTLKTEERQAIENYLSKKYNIKIS